MHVTLIQCTGLQSNQIFFFFTLSRFNKMVVLCSQIFIYLSESCDIGNIAKNVLTIEFRANKTEQNLRVTFLTTYNFSF